MPGGSWLKPFGDVPTHCIAVDTKDGVVLIDTGFGLEDRRNAWFRLNPLFVLFSHPDLDESKSLVNQLKNYGYKPEDIKHIFLTHLDLDHAGGLSDFPDATVHVDAVEYEAAQLKLSFKEKMRYYDSQFKNHPVKWKLYHNGHYEWYGFNNTEQIIIGGVEFFFVPLTGHTRGHRGVAVKGDDHWLFHCGDAYFHHAELDPENKTSETGILWYESNFAVNQKMQQITQNKLKEAAAVHRNEIEFICSHDLRDMRRLKGFHSF